MYRYRLRKWGVWMNWRRQSKDLLLAQLSDPILSLVSTKSLPPNHASDRMPTTSLNTSLQNNCQKESFGYDNAWLQSDESSYMESENTTFVWNQRPASNTIEHFPSQYDVSLSSLTLDELKMENHNVARLSASCPDTSLLGIAGWHDSALLPLNPEPRMSSLDLVMKMILAKVDTVDLGTPCINPSGSGVLASASFWTDLSYSIYLFKINFAQRAWPLLHQACNTAVTSDFVDLSGLCDLLTTLSPVNTRVCPNVRRSLFRYLDSMSNHRFGQHHPTTVIIRQLGQNDTDNELLERAISYLQGVLITRWGSSHPLREKSHIASLRMLRRNHKYEKALYATRIFVHDTQSRLGEYSLQARRAARELEHVLMDMQNYHEALGICYNIIKGEEGIERDDGEMLEQNIIEDKVSADTMEDIAKIFEQTNRPDRYVEWLQRAARLAEKLWPPDSISLQHILDKLEAVVEKE